MLSQESKLPVYRGTGGNSESLNSQSGGGGSISISGQKFKQHVKSLKSSHTIEKTYSDFFNLTQEGDSAGGLDQILMHSSSNNKTPTHAPNLQNFILKPSGSGG